MHDGLLLENEYLVARELVPLVGVVEDVVGWLLVVVGWEWFLSDLVLDHSLWVYYSRLHYLMSLRDR